MASIQQGQPTKQSSRAVAAAEHLPFADAQLDVNTPEASTNRCGCTCRKLTTCRIKHIAAHHAPLNSLLAPQQAPAALAKPQTVAHLHCDELVLRHARDLGLRALIQVVLHTLNLLS
jgi:hypothetical protein